MATSCSVVPPLTLTPAITWPSLVLRRPLAGPPPGHDRKRRLSGLLGEVDVAEEADQGREDSAPLAPEDLPDQ
jgi:hypothetical protein